MLGDGPGEERVGEFRVARRARRDDFQFALRDPAVVAVLREPAAGDRLHDKAAACRVGQFAGEQQAKILLLREDRARSEEHTSELQSLMRTSYAVFCLKK